MYKIVMQKFILLMCFGLGLVSECAFGGKGELRSYHRFQTTKWFPSDLTANRQGKYFYGSSKSKVLYYSEASQEYFLGQITPRRFKSQTQYFRFYDTRLGGAWHVVEREKISRTKLHYVVERSATGFTAGNEVYYRKVDGSVIPAQVMQVFENGKIAITDFTLPNEQYDIANNGFYTGRIANGGMDSFKIVDESELLKR